MSDLRKDSDGLDLRDGDLIHFGYGTPGVAVEARLVERNGHLVALTPGHTPAECRLDKLKRHVGQFYKSMPARERPDEIEANPRDGGGQ